MVFRAHIKSQNHIQQLPNEGDLAIPTSVCLVIRHPGSGVLTFLARSMILSLLVVSFPWLSSLKSGIASMVSSKSGTGGPEFLPLLFHDLRNEGLLKVGDKSLFVSGEDEKSALHTFQLSSDNEMLWVSETDVEKQNSIGEEVVDFAFVYSSRVSDELVDRTLKVGGIFAVQLNKSPTLSFKKPENYKVIYVRQFDSKVLVMRKTDSAERPSMPAKRKLLAFGDEAEAKKKALNQLEDVLLEPPRAASRKSRTYQKRTRYLPDLMGDSLHLESYPRRVFIDVGLPEREGGSRTNWFTKNYPTRNLEFEMYKIETVTEESSGKEVVPQMGMSDWLRENVKEEEYVVMKAEADVVEEMVKNKGVIGLVDELFLECKPKGLGYGGRRGLSRHNNGRAYWECLALYGKLRDEGVAVHQWWG